MKTTPSGTMKAIALAGLSVATLITLRALAQTSPPASKADDINNFVLQIKKNPDEYHLLKKNTNGGEAELTALLCDTKNHAFDQGKHMHFKSKNDPAAKKPLDLPTDCTALRSSASPGAQLNIKTNKVMVANAAQSVAAGDPHVTIQVASKSPADIKAVLDLLAEQ
jgi:hypothetical protein